MIFDSKRLELFRNLKIRKSELYGNDTDLPSSQVNAEQKVQILPGHIIAVLEKYKSKEITEDQFVEWTNTVWFTDLFEYYDECSDCISHIVGEQEEANEGEHKLDDRKIEKYIQTLLNIDDATATDKPKTEMKFLLRDHLLSIVVGIQVLYAAIKILIYLTYVVGFEVSVLINPISIIVLIPYICIVFLGIEFIREKPFAWYGITSSFLYLLYKNIIGLITLGAVIQFGDLIASFYKKPLAEVKITHFIPMVIGVFITVFVLKLLLENDTLERFDLKVKSKLILILINTGIVGVAFALYFGGVMLLVNNYA